MQDQIDTLSEKYTNLVNLPEVEYKTINSNILKRSDSKLSKLIKSEGTLVKIGKGGVSLTFKNVIFIKTISFISSSESKSPNLKLSSKLATGEEKIIKDFKKSEHNENRIYFNITNFVNSINIQSVGKFRREEIKQVIICGALSEEFFELINILENFLPKQKNFKEEARDLLEKIQDEKTQIDVDKQNFESKKIELQNSIAESEKSLIDKERQLGEIEEKISESKNELKEVEEKSENAAKEENRAKDSSVQLQEQRNQLNKEISELRTEIDKLSNRKHLYTEDIAGFNQAGNRHRNMYYFLLILLIIILGYLGYQAIEKINVLITYYEHFKTNNVDTTGWDLIIMRAPYAVLLSLVIAGFLALGKTLIDRIFQINDQIRGMIGLSFLAERITSSSAKDLNMTDAEIFEKREDLKLDLVSESIIKKEIFESTKKKRKNKHIYKDNKISEQNKE